VLTEEESFEKTVDQGLLILNDYINEIKNQKGSMLSEKTPLSFMTHTDSRLI
jgi:alanyl-tRNA synthetase